MVLPTLYRRRLIPEECIRLSDDRIVYADDEMIITKWTTLHPKPNLTHGISCYFLNKGIKVSKFYNHDFFKFWYCDIIRTDYEAAENRYTFTDLLIDVILKPDGSVKIVDLDELGDAAECNLLTTEDLSYALHTADSLLRCIYKGDFPALIQKLEAEDSRESC